MPNKPLSPRRTAERVLCPVPTANVMHMKVHEGEINPELLSALDIAALRWAGIDPHDHATWIVHRGDRGA